MDKMRRQALVKKIDQAIVTLWGDGAIYIERWSPTHEEWEGVAQTEDGTEVYLGNTLPSVVTALELMLATPRFVNLTPHAINVRVGDLALDIPPTGTEARLKTNNTPNGEILGCPIFTQKLGEVVGLPDPVDNVFYIVSKLVRLACPNRLDVLSPAIIRNEKGSIIGCDGFERNAPL